MGRVLRETATSEAKTPMVTVQCRDLDEVTTKREICNTMHTLCRVSKPEESAIGGIRATYNGIQTTFTSLPAEDARKALEVQRMGVGGFHVVCVRSRHRSAVSAAEDTVIWPHDAQKETKQHFAESVGKLVA